MYDLGDYKRIIAIKQFSVHWGKQAAANFKKYILHYSKETDLMGPGNYRGKVTGLQFLSQSV